ncbi:hypothetical protein CC1G_08672 [Coprinopsis cinerea okayama7|uniref:Uncharacterized protein n=1 Tax=Coprinopsis cinerea (strain Okayama-7 / 130 / ATCC MYA-4618 / FGSC 9003) TaxID=240176 RepID=A8NZE4_COPC7|nr:hypothetical protein CC1G_08672 [Coprinopsis cinerea okayama7\|eukprot:XP_001837659.1 hypothetical protein CC1G_08672 [Coprinopsis cinerea okayama7\
MFSTTTRKFASATKEYPSNTARKVEAELDAASSSASGFSTTSSDSPSSSSSSSFNNASSNHSSNALDLAGLPRLFTSPTRPDVYYHLQVPPTPFSATEGVYAVSFLDEPGVVREVDGVVVGWVGVGGVGELAASPAGGGKKEGEIWREFRENPVFRSLLHETVYAALRDGVDDVWVGAAKQVGSGWMHVHDQRNPPPLGRIGDPDDIIGTVLVEDGVVKADTYQPMPSYRFWTKDGLMMLTDGLRERLVQSCRRVGGAGWVQSNP